MQTQNIMRVHPLPRHCRDLLTCKRNLYASPTPDLLGRGQLDIYYGKIFNMHDMLRHKMQDNKETTQQVVQLRSNVLKMAEKRNKLVKLTEGCGISE